MLAADPVTENHSRSVTTAKGPIYVGLLTGGQDKPYAYGLSMALASKGIRVDIIGSDEIDGPDLHNNEWLNFLNLRGDQQANATLREKVTRVASYYFRLIGYAFRAKPKIFHILWNNRFQVVDRTILMLYYRALGKRIVLTAHNVNAGKRDSTDSLLNRLTLRIQYRLSDHIFVHTDKMKQQLLEDFGARAETVSVIPFGLNNSVPNTELTCVDAKRHLRIPEGSRTILFFGRIGAYKGLKYLVSAFQRLAASDVRYRLLIIGKTKSGHEEYVEAIRQQIKDNATCAQIIQKCEFVPDHDTEIYFKAADILVLPYTEIFQSGVLFLAYSFGLPVIATDVGSFKEDIVDGITGYICQPHNVNDLSRTIELYFESDLFRTLSAHRPEIREYARRRNSWEMVSETTQQVYADLLAG